MENNTNDFVQGLFVDKKDTQYGEIIKLSFKAENFIEWLKANINEKGYVNVDILTAQSGKKYAKKNTYVPQTQSTETQTQSTETQTESTETKTDDLPF